MNFIEFGRRFPPSKLLLLTCLVTPVVLASRALATIFGKTVKPADDAHPDLSESDSPQYRPIDPNIFFGTMQSLQIEILESNERRPLDGPWVLLEPGCFDHFEGDQAMLDALIEKLCHDLEQRIDAGDLAGPVLVRAHKALDPAHRAKRLN